VHGYRLFWQEFRRTFHSTGAVLPSGRSLCRALASQVVPCGRPRRILEVGPGTGVVTDAVVARMGPQDTLDLVELNDRFAEALRVRQQREAAWQDLGARLRIHHQAVEDHVAAEPYETLVSGLPLNNFAAEAVESIFGKLRELADEGATLSFFEYVGIRRIKSLAVSRRERQRLAGVQQAMERACAAWEFKRQMIAANVPPAWVHHLRFDAAPDAARR